MPIVASGAYRYVGASRSYFCLVPEARRHFTSTSSWRAKGGIKPKLPLTPARTRFAPSPTGYLHLGSLRTALFNYLLAKKTGGQFLLRLEDTDQKRTVPDAEQRLYDDLKWAGLLWDEGPEVGGPHGPYKQSLRTSIYKKHTSDLLKTPHAYRCFCTPARLQSLAEHRASMGLPTDYDRTCASISTIESDARASAGSEPFVVRLRSPDRYPDFVDLIYGRVGRLNSEASAGVTHKHGQVVYEDPVLVKSDGLPTYHLANVVDDHLMQVTHVVRGTEWLSSTPRHLALYNAFGWTPPSYAHVGLLVDENDQKLSKRNMAADLATYTSQGVLKDAIVNFAALLGWSHSRRSDVMDLAELVEEFQMKFTKGNSTVTMGKLWYLQREHAARTAKAHLPAFEEMIEAVTACVEQDLSIVNIQEAKLPLKELRDKIKTLLELNAHAYTIPTAFARRNRFIFRAPSPSRRLSEFSNPSPHIVSSMALLRVAAMLLSVAQHPASPATPTFPPPLATEIPSEILSHHFPLQPGASNNKWTAPNIDSSMMHLRRLAVASAHSSSPPSSDELATKDVSDEEKMWGKEWYRCLCRMLRWVLVDGDEGPNVAAVMEVLGREECARRLWGVLEAEGLVLDSGKDWLIDR